MTPREQLAQAIRNLPMPRWGYSPAYADGWNAHKAAVLELLAQREPAESQGPDGGSR